MNKCIITIFLFASSSLLYAQKDANILVNKKYLPKGVSEAQIKVALVKHRVRERIKDSIANLKLIDSLKQVSVADRVEVEKVKSIFANDKSGNYLRYNKSFDSIILQVKDAHKRDSLIKQLQNRFLPFFEQALSKGGVDKDKELTKMGFYQPKDKNTQLIMKPAYLMPLKKEVVPIDTVLVMPFHFGNTTEISIPSNNTVRTQNVVSPDLGQVYTVVSVDNNERVDAPVDVSTNGNMGYFINKPAGFTSMQIITLIDRLSSLSITATRNDPRSVSSMLSLEGCLSLSTLNSSFDTTCSLFEDQIFRMSDNYYQNTMLTKEVRGLYYYSVTFLGLPINEEKMLLTFTSKSKSYLKPQAAFSSNLSDQNKIMELSIRMY